MDVDGSPDSMIEGNGQHGVGMDNPDIHVQDLAAMSQQQGGLQQPPNPPLSPRARMQNLSKEKLAMYFHLPILQASKELGTFVFLMRRCCFAYRFSHHPTRHRVFTLVFPWCRLVFV